VVAEDDFIFADDVIYGGSTTLCAAVGLAVAVQHAHPSACWTFQYVIMSCS